MLAWLSKNIATIIICLVLAVIVTLIIFSLVKNKKKGKSSCGCKCAHCAMAPATARISKRAKSTADKHNRTEKRTQRKLRPFCISRWIFPRFADIIKETAHIGGAKLDISIRRIQNRC